MKSIPNSNKFVENSSASVNNRALADIDKQLHIICQEIVSETFKVSRNIAWSAFPHVTEREQEEKTLRLCQLLIFYCLGFAESIVSVFDNENNRAINSRLPGIFCNLLYQEGLSEHDKPAAFEYFKLLFQEEYASFLREIGGQGMLDMPPDDFFRHCISDILASPILEGASTGLSDDEIRRPLAELLEKNSFLKISRIILFS